MMLIYPLTLARIHTHMVLNMHRHVYKYVCMSILCMYVYIMYVCLYICMYVHIWLLHRKYVFLGFILGAKKMENIEGGCACRCTLGLNPQNNDIHRYCAVH